MAMCDGASVDENDQDETNYWCIKQETPLSLTNRATHLWKFTGMPHLTTPHANALARRIWLLEVQPCTHKYRGETATFISVR